ncbi:ABC transporter [Thermococcus sp. EP1]|uniref:AbgT family transporter n=1 Tax=Thermococcus sp. EP1 TaxID=1591054 RepID=UPI0006D9FBA2|nr:AbgT family transporter [Thermococcus sp. EP1]KPU62506.1 ABC transporter [Thermococcus sp. EP1]
MPEEKGGALMRFINWIEKVGNKLPHMFWIFLGLWVLVILLSGVLAGVSAIDPAKGEEVAIVSLLNKEGLYWILTNIVKNFAQFPPLGLVLVMMMAAGFAERAGFIPALMRTLTKVPDKYLIPAIFILGICGNLASDASLVIIPPLTAALFYSRRKDPIFGLILGYAAASSGFTANLFIAGTDVLLSGITDAAAKIVDSNYNVYPTANYYFMVASTFIITAVATIFTVKYAMPRFARWEEEYEHAQVPEEYLKPITDYEMRALKKALLAAGGYFLLMLLLTIMPNGPLRDPTQNTIVPSTFLKGMVPILFLFFVIGGYVYGKSVGTVKRPTDMVNYMADAMKTMASYLVIILPIANFTYTFKHTNMASVLAIKLADFLKSAGFTGIGLFISIILIATFINLFITSGSTKWAFLAPVLVPMMYYLGYTPEWAQLLYRLGDSSTNSFTPLSPYFPVIIGYASIYKKDVGIGTIISRTFLYSMLFLVTWIILAIIWYLLGFPLGPGAPIKL